MDKKKETIKTHFGHFSVISIFIYITVFIMSLLMQDINLRWFVLTMLFAPIFIEISIIGILLIITLARFLVDD